PSFTLTASSPLPLRRRRLPFATGSRPAKGRPPLRGVATPARRRHPCEASPPLLATRLAAAGRAYGWPPITGCCPYGRPPLAGSQAMAGRPYRGPGRGQPPLHADNMHVVTPPP
ncbi:hypothetical protein BHM03_00058047, partial [Ensete ventricosum]